MIKKQKTPEVAIPIDSTTIVKEKVKFAFNQDGEYYCLIVVENGKGDLNKFKAKLSDYNSESFSTADIAITSIFLDITHQMVSVKTFDGKERAMDYFDAIESKKDLYADLEKGTYEAFVISAENYAIFYKDKNIEEYHQFFVENFK